MADQSDVEQVLAEIASGVLYPLGTSAPSVVGAPCQVFRGWPVAASLDAALAAGRVTVTVAADPRVQQTTTRFPDEWAVARAVTVSLQAAVAGSTVTFSGSADPGQVAGVLADGVACVHRTVLGDTPSSVASALAKAFALTTATLGTATASGATLTVPNAARLAARVVADQPSVRETRRQLQGFCIACWCPSPGLRDAVANALDQAFSTMHFVGLPDGMAGKLHFAGTRSTDRVESAGLFRRDLIYAVDYATTITADLPRMLFGESQTIADGVVANSALS